MYNRFVRHWTGRACTAHCSEMYRRCTIDWEISFNRLKVPRRPHCQFMKMIPTEIDQTAATRLVSLVHSHLSEYAHCLIDDSIRVHDESSGASEKEDETVNQTALKKKSTKATKRRVTWLSRSQCTSFYCDCILSQSRAKHPAHESKAFVELSNIQKEFSLFRHSTEKRLKLVEKGFRLLRKKTGLRRVSQMFYTSYSVTHIPFRTTPWRILLIWNLAQHR